MPGLFPEEKLVETGQCNAGKQAARTSLDVKGPQWSNLLPNFLFYIVPWMYHEQPLFFYSENVIICLHNASYFSCIHDNISAGMIQHHNMPCRNIWGGPFSVCHRTKWSDALNVLLIWVSLTSSALGHKALQNFQGKGKVFSPLLCFPHIPCSSVSLQGLVSFPVDPSSDAVSMPSCQGLLYLARGQ